MLKTHAIPSRNRAVAAVAALILVAVLAVPAAAQQGTLTLAKTNFAPGELITCYFTASADLPSNAWIGLIPSSIPHGQEEINDQHDQWYEYLSGRTDGYVQLYAPVNAGTWDLRLNESDNGGLELASVTFTIAGEPVASGGSSLSLDKTTYAPGEAVVVHFTAESTLPSDAWVGLIPSSTPHGDEGVNDGADIAYEYVSGRPQGDMVFTAPSTPGSWDLRLNYSDAGGAELASVTFTVQGQAMGQGNSLTLDRSSYAPGEAFVVHFTADAGLPQDAWVGLIPSSTPHGDEAVNDGADMAYSYVSGLTSGEMTFIAPDAPGSYDLRLNYSDAGGAELASVTFTVGQASPYSLAPDKAAYMPGETILLFFTVPDGLPTDAWVGLIPSNTPHGDEAVNDEADIAYEYLSGRTQDQMMFMAPDMPGSYDFRLNYSDQGGDELASVTFTVQ